MKKEKKMFLFGCLTILLLISFSSVTFPIFVSQTIKKQQTILIDPGHGGSDPGKVGSGSILEKDINLSLSLQLKKILEKEKFKVYLTRDGDYNLASSTSNVKISDLKNRKQQIFDLEPAAVISIHQNSYPSGEVSGAQVFYYQGASDSKLLADSIQSALIKGLDPSNRRQAKSNADYYLLRDNPYPTVIVECGFLSNAEELKKLQSKTYQKKAAKCIRDGLKKYLKQIS
ncbi:MAG TPA: N-acetylmuramoyl-L-alanine amidase [Candidatus Anaerostipes excrementavium]|uniref:N-acetylmuramoyl-L-alanine amidase n=1 Tax=Candidatus Anaerostipes excrementavium TaxID=2838463 RepID=A0A9D1WV27_9FIRM|nr:N-acetylmuramoyl-L-alanine amidase [uncultured Anaerostipes sp.]HIX67749.1 N-acetylmuramoyl-L-alanine amidase [Candidatus Anaerostipes excrementavium]